MVRRYWGCAREKKCRPYWARLRPDGLDPVGVADERHPGLDGEAMSKVRPVPAGDVPPANEDAAKGMRRFGGADQGADRSGTVVRLSHSGSCAGVNKNTVLRISS